MEKKRSREKKRKKEMLKELLNEIHEVEMARQNSITVLHHNMGYRLSREDVELLIYQHVQYELAVKRLAWEELVWVGIVRDEGHLRLHRQLDGGYASTILPVTEQYPFEKLRSTEWKDRFSSLPLSTDTEEEVEQGSRGRPKRPPTGMAEVLRKWFWRSPDMKQQHDKQQLQEEEEEERAREREKREELEEEEMVTYGDIMEEMFADKQETDEQDNEKENEEQKEEETKWSRWRNGWKRLIGGRSRKKKEIIVEKENAVGEPSVVEPEEDAKNREWSQQKHQKQRDSASFSSSATKFSTPPYPTSYASSSLPRAGVPRDHFSTLPFSQSRLFFGRVPFLNSPSLSLEMKEEVIVIKKPSSSPIRRWWTKWATREDAKEWEMIEKAREESLDVRKQTLFRRLRKAVIHISTTRVWLPWATFVVCGVFFVLL